MDQLEQIRRTLANRNRDAQCGASCPRGYTHYTWRANDTAASVAALYGVSEAELATVNPDTDWTALEAGDEICIPVARANTPTDVSVADDPADTAASDADADDPDAGLAVALLSDAGDTSGETLTSRVCPGGYIRYTWSAGDTLASVADSYDVSEDDIAEANPGIVFRRLNAGDVICIPASEGSGETITNRTCPDGYTRYTWRASDTLAAVASRYRVSADAISEANPGVVFTRLNAGDIICIPPASSGETITNRTCPSGYTRYTWRASDTLAAVASRYRVSADAISEANPGVVFTRLNAGDIICIPPASSGETITNRTCPDGYTRYTWRASDTLAAVASRYRVSADAISEANPGVVFTRLNAGDIICIPPASSGETITNRTCPDGYTRYTWRASDTLAAVASRYRVSADAISEANPGVVFTRLNAGDIICIPPTSSGETITNRTCPSGYTRYTWRATDTLAAVARRYGLRQDAIAEANPGVVFTRLNFGDEICIPYNIVVCPNGRIYTVRRGDTFSSIASVNGTTVLRLTELNPYIDPAALQIGQLICLPPQTVPPVECPSTNISILMPSGWSYATVLTRYGISYNALQQSNPQLNIDSIPVGQQLCIPPRGSRGACYYDGGVTYLMTSGETLETLAQSFNTTAAILLRINPNLAPADFVEGRIVCVPGEN